MMGAPECGAALEADEALCEPAAPWRGACGDAAVVVVYHPCSRVEMHDGRLGYTCMECGESSVLGRCGEGPGELA